ncbi:hypothetical protein ACFSM5_20250 [Lacibacterium aquatile]|uniref:Endonuclease/exonuclease/phosphatase family protein n=1 Tax=Lacibacterium aquatile TaxID=1168082 RepID=A0ABW5DZ44_9PROT
MTNIMFWNIKQGSAANYLEHACLENDVDVLIIAEDSTENGNVESILNRSSDNQLYFEYKPVPSLIKFFFKGTSELNLVSDVSDRVSVRSVKTKFGNTILIAGVHIPSKLHNEDVDQYYFSRRIKSSIEQAEMDNNNNKSIIIGDLNMNPFEHGVTAHDGLHGVMDKDVALKISREYSGNESGFFYNPMWSRLGDESDGPPGTYYYNKSGAVNYYWNTFDQILIRPSLLPYYTKDGLKILTKIGTTNLLKNNNIIESRVSDHLPIMLTLDH